jgi:hypothetical protein
LKVPRIQVPLNPGARRALLSFVRTTRRKTKRSKEVSTGAVPQDGPLARRVREDYVRRE